MIIATAKSAKSSNTVTADVNGVVTVVNVARDLTVASGDVILVEKVGAQWFAIQRIWDSAPAVPDNDPTPNPQTPETSGSLVVAPVETRSYRPNWGWRTDNTDVYQGFYGSPGNHTGCAFYGAKPRSIEGATVTVAKIKVRRKSGGTYAAQSTTMRLVTQATRPSGAPTLTSSTSGPSLAVNATNDAFDIPNSWAQAMVDGAAGGLAFFESDGSPYVVFAGRGTWSPAFTLTISWTRS